MRKGKRMRGRNQQARKGRKRERGREMERGMATNTFNKYFKHNNYLIFDSSCKIFLAIA